MNLTLFFSFRQRAHGPSVCSAGTGRWIIIHFVVASQARLFWETLLNAKQSESCFGCSDAFRRQSNDRKKDINTGRAPGERPDRWRCVTCRLASVQTSSGSLRGRGGERQASGRWCVSLCDDATRRERRVSAVVP